MPNPPASQYKVSNNPGRPSRGAARAVVTSLAKRATRSVSGRKKGAPTIVETNPSSPSREPNLSDPKRRDMKATPPSHTHTKAKERASRVAVPEEAVDPVAGLNSGAGALSTDEAPLNRAGLDSTAKTLFAESSGDKKKASPKNKSTNFFQYDQDKALEVALEQTVLERKKSEEDSAADGNANIDLSVDEYSGEIAAVAADEGKGEAGSVGEDEKDEDEVNLIAELAATAGKAQEFLAVYQRIQIELDKAESDLYDREEKLTDKMDAGDQDGDTTNNRLRRHLHGDVPS